MEFPLTVEDAIVRRRIINRYPARYVNGLIGCPQQPRRASALLGHAVPHVAAGTFRRIDPA